MSETCDVVNCSAESEANVLITDVDGGASPMRLCKTCEMAYKIGKRDE
jgi:hypothetical protein